jgi:hypothetical protein
MNQLLKVGVQFCVDAFREDRPAGRSWHSVCVSVPIVDRLGGLA